MRPPTIAVATMAMSRGSRTSYARYASLGFRFGLNSDWLNCQKPMMTNEPIARIDAPPARPSSPSVTLTPFEAPTVIRQIQTT